jgi:DNA gyrase subunit B
MENTKKTEQNYAASDIQVLGGLEAVRRRPGMYIGSTDQRGLHHLIYEIVYNSVDEAMAGYCDHVFLTLHADKSVTVEDNGRGIPVEKHPVTNISALETVLTILHAGAKFGGKTYQVSGGLHGVGASVVNALSRHFKVITRRDGLAYYQEYKRGIPVGPVTEIGPMDERGTVITFLPDEEIFPTIEYDFDVLCERMRELAYLNKGLFLSIIDEASDRESGFYFEGGISSFIQRLNRNHNALHSPIYIYRQDDSTITEIAIQYNDGYSENILSFVNCINTSDGGTHVTGFRSALTRAINDYARKSKLLKEEDTNLTGEDTRQGLVAIINIKMPEPQFEGQTKAKLGNIEVKGLVENVTAAGISLYLEEHPDEARTIVDKCLIAAKAREAARKARELVIKKSSLDGDLPGKLADCSSKNPAECELFIVEGESAGGSAKQGRNRRFQAILPLRGKILNVEKAPQDKIFSHSEIRAIATALGAGIDSDFNPAKLRYHKIILMADADVDGAHICTLLLTLFFRHLPQVISDGHLYIAMPPLYRLKAGKEEYWAYSEEEKETYLAKLDGKRVEIQRYKGLGEMNAEQLWETTMNPETRTLLQVTVEDFTKADNIFTVLMGKEVAPRRQFIQTHARAVRNLDI